MFLLSHFAFPKRVVIFGFPAYHVLAPRSVLLLDAMLTAIFRHHSSFSGCNIARATSFFRFSIQIRLFLSNSFSFSFTFSPPDSDAFILLPFTHLLNFLPRFSLFTNARLTLCSYFSYFISLTLSIITVFLLYVVLQLSSQTNCHAVHINHCTICIWVCISISPFLTSIKYNSSLNNT